MCMGHDRISHGIEGQGHSRVKVRVRVSVRNAVGGSSILYRGSFLVTICAVIGDFCNRSDGADNFIDETELG